jgi:hypothetical protein
MVTEISCTNEACTQYGIPKTLFGGGDWPEDVPTLCGHCGTQLLGPEPPAPPEPQPIGSEMSNDAA